MARFDPPLTTAEIAAAFDGRFTDPVLINSGGQGSVYKCFSSNGEVVAVKIYVPDSGAHIEERTDREVAALHYTNCPSIVGLRAYGHALLRGESCRVVTTAFIEGETIGSRLGTGAPMTISEVAQCACDIAEAISAMWESPARIVHRDIKPPNVMWTPQRRAVVIDLGIARHTTMESLTATGNMWGTPT